MITVPAAPTFVENDTNSFYWEAIRIADYNIIDSSFFAILARFKGFQIYKYSGFQLVKDALKYLCCNRLRIFWVNPNDISDKINKKFLLENTCLTIENIDSYCAPFYPKKRKYRRLGIIETNKSL